MIISYIKFVEFPEESFDEFDPHFNLITSENVNSIGKSTFCRLIFYALGYGIPSTENIKFERIKTEIEIIEKEKRYVITRDINLLCVNNIADSFSREFVLPSDHIAFISFVFGTENPLIAKNLLGLMYIDQEKGWTLLNRGKVIGGLRFSIDELIAALKGTNCDDLFAKRSILEETIERYQSLLTMNSIKEEYYEHNNDLEILSVSDELKRKMASLQLSIQDTKRDIDEINLVIRKDRDFFAYIESMNLYVRNGDELIKITRENIENSCSIDYLLAQKSILENYLHKLNHEKVQLQKQIESAEQIPNLFGENEAIDTERKINNVLSSVNVDIEGIKKALNSTKEMYEQVKKSIRERMRHENEYVSKVYNLFFEYAKELNVEKNISNNHDYIFTDNLKCRTGANFQKLIIAYKVAVLKVVESVLNTKLVFVIDSPKAKELDDNNTRQVMSFLKEKLSDNQVIVASIYSEKELFTNFNKVITLKNRVIEKRN